MLFMEIYRAHTPKRPIIQLTPLALDNCIKIMEKSTYETTQDIEDQYACPENVLEIEVRSPETRNHESERYTDYEIICRVP